MEIKIFDIETLINDLLTNKYINIISFLIVVEVIA